MFCYKQIQSVREKLKHQQQQKKLLVDITNAEFSNNEKYQVEEWMRRRYMSKLSMYEVLADRVH